MDGWMMEPCRYCGKLHSDWLSCDQAMRLGEAIEVPRETTPQVVEKQVEKPTFDRSAFMKALHEKRRSQKK